MPTADHDGSVALKALADLAMSLPIEERAGLALQLLESLDTIPFDEVEGLWQDEAIRRAAQIDRGEVALSSAAEVLAKAHTLLK